MKTALFANDFADVLYLGGDAMQAATVIVPLIERQRVYTIKYMI